MIKCRLCEGSNLSEHYKFEEGDVLYKCNDCSFVQMLVPSVDQLDGVASKESISQDVDRDTSPEDMKLNESIGFSGPMSRMNHILQQDSIRINETIKKLVISSFGSFKGLRFIDIGSGYGFHSFNIKKEFPDLDVHLLEVSGERMRSGIESFNPDLNDFSFYHRILDDDFSSAH